MIRLFKHYVPHAVLLLGLLDFLLLIGAAEAGWILRAHQIGMDVEPIATRIGPLLSFAFAIQTGMINVVPSTPYFALASQIYNSAPNMLDINWAPIVGALVITRKAWDDMTPEVQKAMRLASDKVSVQIRAKARQEVDEAVDAMKKRGLVVNRPTPEQMREWDELAISLYPRLRGTMVPAETFDEVMLHLKNYRAGKGKQS